MRLPCCRPVCRDQELVHETVGSRRVEEVLVHLAIARAGREVEALVLLVAAGERAADEVPAKPEDAHPLFSADVAGAAEIAVD